jgi:hypothetical protein
MKQRIQHQTLSTVRTQPDELVARGTTTLVRLFASTLKPHQLKCAEAAAAKLRPLEPSEWNLTEAVDYATTHRLYFL